MRHLGIVVVEPATELGFIAVLLLWLVPKRQVRLLGISKERRSELENEARKTVAQIVGGAVLLAGL
jgi:hypothetical protein